jgi:uncharacterized protein
MKNKDVYVKESAIHGKGLFAANPISAGDLIGRIDGIPAKRDGRYVLWLSDDQGVRVRCHLRFINHSHRPNAVYYDTLEVIALRNIAPGEEITHNYDQP